EGSDIQFAVDVNEEARVGRVESANQATQVIRRVVRENEISNFHGLSNAMVDGGFSLGKISHFVRDTNAYLVVISSGSEKSFLDGKTHAGLKMNHYPTALT